MDSSSQKIRSKDIITRSGMLIFCLGFLMLTQNIFAAQITASTMEPSFHKGQRFVSVHFVNEPLADVLYKLAQKVKTGLSYKTKAVPDKKVTYKAKRASIFVILDAVLSGTNLQATLSKDRKVILIKKKKPKQQVIYQSTITGTVTDASTGESLPGVNILVKGTTTGTTTDGSGKYELNVESLQDTLRFSFIGYQTREVPIKGRSKIDVTLKTETTGLEEMVVVGFGTQSRRKLVGSVGSVDSEALTEAATSNVQSALSGKVAGLQISAEGGSVGAASSLHIRGTSSINSSSQPLYVIDGIPIVSSGFGAAGGRLATNPLLNLDPENIKSMEVLKDASATAIYGTRGANGVILITTKSGRKQKPQLVLNISGGTTSSTKQYNMLNTKQFLKIYNYRNGLSLDPNDYADTDWMDLIMRTGSKMNYSASYSGGTEDGTYFISGYYNRTNGYVISNGITKLGTQINMSHDFNKKLNIKLSMNPSYSDYEQLQAGDNIAAPFTMAVLEPPTVPLYAKNGQLNNGKYTDLPGNRFASFSGTPYANAVGANIHNRITQIIGNVGISYDFLENLTLKTKFGVQDLKSMVSEHDKDFTQSGFPDGEVTGRDAEFVSYTWQNTLNYKKDWNENSIQAVVGVTYESSVHRYLGGSGNKLPGNDFSALSTASQISNLYGLGTSYRFQNNLARLTYSYKDRYILTLTGSYNGTSRFAEGSRYGFFPSIGLGWIISDEKFMKDLKAVSLLKLTASYGITGNANIGNFRYRGLISAGGNYNDQPGIAISQVKTTNLGWEQSKQSDISLHYGFLNNRIKGELSYYRKINTDLLLASPVSNINGFTSIFKNLGSMENKGIEFSINADILTNKVLWNVSANIASNHNEVTKLPGGSIFATNSGNPTNIIKQGYPTSSYYLAVYKGVDHSNGDALYLDSNGNTTNSISEATKKIVGSANPDFSGGFGTSIAYKGIKLGANFQYSYGAKLFWRVGHYIACNGCGAYNQIEGQQNFWTPKNKDANIPEPRLESNGNAYSTRFLSDASFLRLKSLNLAYTFNFPDKSLKLYINGTNLLTFTDFIGLDPQASIGGSSKYQGVQFYNLPLSRGWEFGIKLTL